jgi:hypothetical protein
MQNMLKYWLKFEILGGAAAHPRVYVAPSPAHTHTHAYHTIGRSRMKMFNLTIYVLSVKLYLPIRS